MEMLALQNANFSTQLAESIQSSMTELWTKVGGFVPNLVGMLAILIIGCIVAKVLQWLTVAILKRVRFDRASDKTGLSESMHRVGIQRTASEIMGILIFWIVMLTFLISAADALGLDNVSKTIDSFVVYLPNVVGSAVVLVIGLLVANFVRTALGTALERIGVDYAAAASNIAYGVLVVVIASLAIGQLQLEVTLVNRVIEIVLMAAGAALAISLGFGTRDLARHVVAGVYARDSFKPGTRLTIGETHGTVEAVTAINTKVRRDDGQTIYIPNAQLVESTVREQVA
jgi:small-conductance mechanosensitive channel